MTTPVSVYMFVTPGTTAPLSPPDVRLPEDPNRQTPALRVVTVIGTATTDSGTYSTTACTAVVFITAAEYTNLRALLADSNYQVRVDLTYDSGASGSSKPIIGSPEFTQVPLLSPGAFAEAVHAVSERIESGVSAELRDDIKYIRATVDSLKLAIDKLGKG
ncbi:MAG TPA: hypothetical protein VK745_02580 [Polyangiaceae bacterium]|jgi:hypothetical protein|nr:hypothetical protein [Polyangiaceae bacterium]